MEVVRSLYSGTETGFPVNNADAGRSVVPTDAVENEEAKTSRISRDAITISPTGKALSLGALDAEEAMALTAQTIQGITGNRNVAFGAHTGLDAYRVASLLGELE